MSTVAEAPPEGVAESEETQEAKSLKELEREHYERTLELSKVADQYECDFESLNDDAKAAKKTWEAAVNRLRAHIRRGPEHLPLIDKPADDEAYLEEQIENAITLTEKQLEKLHGVGVNTVRQFENLRAGQIEGCPDGIRSISGFGESKVDQWEEEILEWLSKNQPIPEAGEVNQESEDELTP